MRGLDPRIHLLRKSFYKDRWIAGSSPAMTADRRELQRDAAPFFGRPIAGVVDLRGLVGQAEIGARLPPDRHAFHEILDLLQVAARPLLFEADELPAGLAIDLLRDVDARQFLLVGQIARHVMVELDVLEPRSPA